MHRFAVVSLHFEVRLTALMCIQTLSRAIKMHAIIRRRRQYVQLRRGAGAGDDRAVRRLQSDDT